MNHKQLVGEIGKRGEITRKEVELVLSLLADLIGEETARGGRVNVRGVGLFGKRIQPPRKVKLNGKNVRVGARGIPTFKPTRSLRDRVA